MNYFYTFPGRDSSHMYVHESYEVPIAAGDQLAITVTALNPQSVIPYTVPNGKNLTVDQDGKIVFPQLGAITVAGLPKSQVRDFLVNKLKTFVNDPVVIVDIVNFKVTVLGEVAKQGVINVPDGKINIVEAIAQSGDITKYGKKHQVLIIREKNGQRQFGWVNLLSHEVFSTPYYRLQQNDIVYIPAIENKPTVEEEKKLRDISVITAVISLVTTLSYVLISILN